MENKVLVRVIGNVFCYDACIFTKGDLARILKSDLKLFPGLIEVVPENKPVADVKVESAPVKPVVAEAKK